MATILVADDNPGMQRMLEYILTRLGHHIVRVGSGVEVLRQVEEAQPDLLILDLAMPEMDGLAALHELRGDERFRKLPIIMLTASGLERDERAARAEGVDAFLTKPFRSRELVEKVDQLLG